jgi:dipeptidyl aminopeptidase/acylaminoacyl peptidase
MKLFSIIKKLSVLLITACSLLLISCEDDPKEDTDPYELWKTVPNEKIVFMSKADSPSGELYLMDKSGEITRLTNNDLHENNPALSRDGKRVAFNAGSETDMLTWEIYVLDLETGVQIQLTDNNVIDAHADWSPDGSKIVFGSFRDNSGNPAGTANIFVMNSDGTELEQLTDTAFDDNDPEWSPDGTKIVFKSTRNTQISGREEIYYMLSNGLNQTRLTTTTELESDHDPSWSPNSNEIVFIRFEGSRVWYDTADFANDWEELTPWNVHSVDLSGNTEKLTYSTDGGWGVAVYSSDEHIIYGTIDWIFNNSDQVIGGMHRLNIMAYDGTNQKQLLPDDEHTGTLEYFDL